MTNVELLLLVFCVVLGVAALVGVLFLFFVGFLALFDLFT